MLGFPLAHEHQIQFFRSVFDECDSSLTSLRMEASSEENFAFELVLCLSHDSPPIGHILWRVEE